MPTVAPLPNRPDDLTESPLYLLAVLHSARQSKDRALEEVTRKKLADLGVRIIFGDELPAPKKGAAIVTDSLTTADVLRVLEGIRDLLSDQSRPPSELLGRDDMATTLGVGLSTFDRLRAAGKIGPRPLELAGVRYHRAEVLEWLAHRDPAGELLDAKSWPTVWTSLQPKSKAR